MFYVSFQMDHGAFYGKLKGVQCASESQTTIYTLITSCQCFVIPLHLYLNIFKSSDPTKVMTNWVGCSAEAVQNTTSQKHNEMPPVSSCRGGGSEEVNKLGWTLNDYITDCALLNHTFTETYTTPAGEK